MRIWRVPPPPPPVTYPFVGPVVTYLCRECLAQVCPTKEPCRKGACCKPGHSVTNLCRGMAAEACYKPRVLIHSLPIYSKLYGFLIMVTELILSSLTATQIRAWRPEVQVYYETLVLSTQIRVTAIPCSIHGK